MAWFFNVPWWAMIVLIPGGAVALACGGHVLVRRSFARTNFIGHNEVAGFIIAVVGVLYAVLLGFITVIVWEQFASAEDRAVQEVDAVTDIWRISALVDPADGRRIAVDLEKYTASVYNDEWPKMTVGGSSKTAQMYIKKLLADAAGMRVSNARESNLQNHVMDRAQLAADLRRKRINSDHSAMPAVVWAAIIIGGLALIGFIYLFGMENFRAQLLMTAATATMIGLCFTIVIKLDYPYRGDVSVSSERWAALHHEIVAGRY